MSKLKTSLPCMGCKAVIGAVKFYLDVLKYSAEQVKNLINNLCSLLAPLKVQKEMVSNM